MATSVADVSSLVDIASVPEPSSPSNPPEETPVETPAETPTETPEEGEGAPEETSEGGDEKPVDGRTNPAAIRSALKEFRDAKPENAPIAKELNNAYGRYTAYKSVFPKVADAQNAKAVLDAVGGHEGISSLQETIKSVNETDSLLYSGDPRVIDNLIEDMKRENKLDAFGKLATPFLDKLRTVDEKSYYDVMKPHFFQGLVDTSFPEVMTALAESLNGETPNIANAKAILGNIQKWFDGLRNTVENGAKATLDPERQAFEKERNDFQTTKQKEFQTGVATACESHNNKALGTELKSYLKLPFFKGFSRESLIDLGSGLKQKLFAELSADKSYQSQMDAFFSTKSPDKGKIESFHAAKVDSMAKRIVKTMLDTRYPGFAKGNAAAGKAAAAKKVTPVAQPGVSTKPIFQSSKPLDKDIDWERDPQGLLFTSGRFYDKTGRLRTWNPRYK